MKFCGGLVASTVPLPEKNFTYWQGTTMATLENMDMKEFGVIFVGALVLTSYIVSLATPWYLVTSAVPFINKDGEEADCFTALQFRYDANVHD